MGLGAALLFYFFATFARVQGTVPVKLYTIFRMFLHIVALGAGLMSELLPVRARGMQGEISVMVPCVTPLGYSYVSTNQWWRFNLTNPLRQIIFVR